GVIGRLPRDAEDLLDGLALEALEHDSFTDHAGDSGQGDAHGAGIHRTRGGVRTWTRGHGWGAEPRPSRGMFAKFLAPFSGDHLAHVLAGACRVKLKNPYDLKNFDLNNFDPTLGLPTEEAIPDPIPAPVEPAPIAFAESTLPAVQEPPS